MKINEQQLIAVLEILDKEPERVITFEMMNTLLKRIFTNPNN